EGSLDREGIASLVNAAVDAGVRGITAMGVMGEAAELTEDERAEVLALVLATARGRVPVVVGVSGASATVVTERARSVAASGADAVMVSPAMTLAVGD